MTGLEGRLLSAAFAQDVLPTLAGATPIPHLVQRHLERWADRRREGFGPTSSARAVADGLIVPLLGMLGFTSLHRVETVGAVRLDAAIDAAPPVPVLVVEWSADLDTTRRAALLAAIAVDARWCLCVNGTAIRIVDAHRTWSRDYLEFDLDLLGQALDLQSLFWSVARAESLTREPSLLAVAIARSAEHGVKVCRSLGDGVLASMRLLLDAPAALSAGKTRPFEQALTVVYRILFLLFAEARGLVPVWHPVYRERYTIEAIVTALLSDRPYRGIWAAIQAISRLAYAGCTAGELRVTAFNGRLFSPAQAPVFEQQRLDDGLVAEAVLAISTTVERTGRARIRYRDLDVEQLGAVYEHILEYEPGLPDGRTLTRNRDVRQATGTFYTPRQITAWLVRVTLEPLVRDRSAEEILSLRVLDPAMGSGAFLVSACHFLARAAEDALVRDGRWHPAEVTAAERALLRREVAQRCLFGVDLNPVAVQLARLSLWLTSLAADKPLTFLDHHLVTGNSLVGAAIEDVARQPTGDRRGRRRPGTLPLFDTDGFAGTMRDATRVRDELARQPDDSADVVRDKERRLAAVHHRDAPVGRWNQMFDLWCSGWFSESKVRVDRGLFAELMDRILRDRTSLPAATTDPILQDVSDVAARHRFLHWTLAFPEVLRGLDPEGSHGFDAVVGNPPWDVVRGDSGSAETREHRRHDARQLTSFVRESGVYRLETRSHLNRYVLFLERALQLTHSGGRIGLVLPAGIVADVSTAPIRRHLFDHADVDTVTGFDNRAGIFPIHRSTRFVLLTCTRGRPTTSVTCRFGLSRPDDLEAPRRSGSVKSPLQLSRAFLTRTSGPEDLGIPELVTTDDLRIVEKISATMPCAGSREGWNLRFGRELNATDDRASLTQAAGGNASRPVLEGKHVAPFRVSLEQVRYELRADASHRVTRRVRLAYRDVAGATNRLTLIAAILPARAATTHTLFCLKNPLPMDTQRVLCGLFNSFVANYLIRLRVGTHVTSTLVAKLRLPLVHPESAEHARIAMLTRALTRATAPPEAMPEYAELQATVAHLYRLSASDFGHILSTFPLMPVETRAAALSSFRDRPDGNWSV